MIGVWRHPFQSPKVHFFPTDRPFNATGRTDVFLCGHWSIEHRGVPIEYEPGPEDFNVCQTCLRRKG